jgi:hypothetical protein
MQQHVTAKIIYCLYEREPIGQHRTGRRPASRLSTGAPTQSAKMRLCQQGLFKVLNCSSAKISLFRQKGGAKLTDSGARSSQPPQARFEGQASQRCDTVVYSKPNRDTTPPPGSMPNRSIILKA